MQKGNFYFLSDQYFVDFPDEYLMRNKESVTGAPAGRPCYYSFLDASTNIYWLIPFSSKYPKFQAIHDKKVAKYKHCDTIVMGEILGYKKAFLIQNMCPVTPKYIISEYIHNSVPVTIPANLQAELDSKAARVLALVRQGKPLIFPNVLAIEQQLIAELAQHTPAPVIAGDKSSVILKLDIAKARAEENAAAPSAPTQTREFTK